MDQPLSRRYGSALADGIPAWELRDRVWTHPYQGIVRPVGADDMDPRVRIADVVAMMQDNDVLTGWAAAHLQGVKYVDGRDSACQAIPITVISDGAGQHRLQSGLHPTRRSLHAHEVTSIDGVAVTTLTRAAYDMALDAPNLREALVAIDMCVSTCVHQGRTTRGNLERLLGQHVKTRGIVQARRALRMSSSRSASPWESRTRWVALSKAGFDGLEVNVPIFDLEGTLCGIVDLLDRRSGFVIESDGAEHREEFAHASDNVREEGVERLGLFVSRVSSVDHRNEQQLVSRLRQARLHARMRKSAQLWTSEKPKWWWSWPPGRRWD